MSNNEQPGRQGEGYRYEQIPPEQSLQNRGFPEQGLQNQEPQYGGYIAPSQGPGGPITKNYGDRHLTKISEQPRRPPNPWKGATLLLLIITIILLATTVIGFMRANSSITQSTTPTTSAPHITATSVNPTPTNAATQTAVPTSPATQPPNATAPPSTALTPVPDGTIKENITLSCGGCNDPILVTINTVQIDNVNRRMIWDTTLKDESGVNANYSINEYDLEANASQTKVPATFSQPGGSLVNNTPLDIQGIFAFVPFHNLTYTFTVVIYTNTLNDTITFDPVKLTF